MSPPHFLFSGRLLFAIKKGSISTISHEKKRNFEKSPFGFFKNVLGSYFGNKGPTLSFSKRQSVIFYFNFSSEVHERQREKKLTEERYRAKDRKRKRDKYAELVGQSLGLKLQLEFLITLIFQALRARTLD